VGLHAFAAAQGGAIDRASYGEGRRRVDVTSQVQSLVRNGTLDFRLTNEALGVSDPAPGRAKDLHIRVRQWNGKVRDYRFQEKSQVTLQVEGDSYEARLNPDDQRRFDSYYTRWLQYRREDNRGEIASMERRMRDLYSRYRIQMDVPFDRVASRNVRNYRE
jgi:hypothetical protein